MISYVSVGTNNFEQARRFFDELFSCIGATRLHDFEKTCAWSTGSGQAVLAVTKPFDGNPATAGNGTMLSIALNSRAEVAQLHAKALQLGGANEGDPGVRAVVEGRDFFAAYFRDLDGNKFAAVSFGPE